ncbi:MAG TPA: hypothetical protein VK694_06385 [Verrucomicrobiae bacterium]|nr:hypothetical protein [Verrucomicrobiae bacterium]
MSAELIVHSEVPPLTWQEFIETHPVGSIALDGYVGEGPQYEPEGPYLNANHHEGVKRLETLSTAQQILMNVRMGLDKAFTRDGVFAPKVYVNDCDQDVCAAWYLLNHVEQAKTVTNPTLNRFINVAGTLDATAGAFPYDRDLRILGELAWVFEPYTMFRASGEMASKDNEQYRSVIQSVEARIQQHLVGGGESAKIDARYKLVGGGQDWKMIEEVGKDGRVGALVDGIDAYVAVQELPGERWRYTVGRRSEFIPFDVPVLIDRLNQVEACEKDRWGGATIIGGSPRVSGSKLSPAKVEKVINEFIAEAEA